MKKERNREKRNIRNKMKQVLTSQHVSRNDTIQALHLTFSYTIQREFMR